MNKMQEYEKYIKKCEMTGTKMFEFEMYGGNIEVKKYIENNEQKRVVRIPDFVDIVMYSTFDGVRQDLEIIADNLKNIRLDGYKGENLKLNNINTEKIKSMYCMFGGCCNLKSLDLSKFNTSKVENMSFMFYKCINLEKIDISSFNIKKAKNDIENMFCRCEKLKIVIANKNTKEFMEKHRKEIGLIEDVVIQVK